jgi:hypothetical protein
MFRVTRVAVWLFGTALATAAAAGCQSSHMSAERSAVVCDKCGMAVRTPYTVPSYEGPRQVGYLTTKAPECSSCRDAQANYAATGTFDPACKTCGGTMSVTAGK